MNDYSSLEIEIIVSQFNKRTLAKELWTHDAHIIVAIWHHLNYDYDTALQFMKSRIKVYNESVGTLNTTESGYHETLTIFWMIYTKNYLTLNKESTLEGGVNGILNSRDFDKAVPLKYYSEDLLFSKEARLNWVNGNIQEIVLRT